MKYLLWLLKAAIFFTLFAFALNNQQDATVHFFFGTQWRAPLVLVVLAAFAAGIVTGVLGMVPRWWRHRSAALQAQAQTRPPMATAPTPTATPPSSTPDTSPPHGI
jgi:uncharacterized integral membrane protein